MHDFKFIKGNLFCEKISVIDIAGLVKTPFYLYSKKTFLDHFRKVDNAFSSIEHIVCYSLKANANLSVLRFLASAGSGADVVSAGEIYKALKAGIPSNKLVFAGVGKREDEIRYAIKNRILMFNVESVSELKTINKVAGQMKRRVKVALRVNPDVDPKTHKFITTGKKENKFGISMPEAEKIYLDQKRYRNLEFSGVHAHIGSQITTLSPYVEAMKRLAGFVGRLRKKGIALEWLNIGGGLGIIYKKETPSTAKKFADAILPIVGGLGLRIIIEPGRFISGNGGILVSKVLYLKISGKKRFVIVDGGMNDLIRPALYGGYHEIVPLIKKRGAKKSKVDVVGPICESSDFFAKDRMIENVNEGDYLAVMGAGAYGFTMSSNYNGRPRVSEVLVDGNRFRIVKKKETFEDLVRGEK